MPSRWAASLSNTAPAILRWRKSTGASAHRPMAIFADPTTVRAASPSTECFRMGSLLHVPALLVVVFWRTASCEGYDRMDSFADSLLRDLLVQDAFRARAENSLSSDYMLHEAAPQDEQVRNRVIKDYEARRDGLLGREPSLRDQEYLEHSSLFGHQYVQGGAGEGFQRLKPDGSVRNVQVVKTDGVLPAYCNPPDPCPLGYTADDGCLERFENTAAFSREYQAAQECMCDSEHMFDCPGATRDKEIDALARSFDNKGLTDETFHRLLQNMQIEGEHKSLVAKKFFSQKPANPFLEGDQLPVVAKKAPTLK